MNQIKSICIGLPIQALIYCHPAKIMGQKSLLMVGHSPTNIHIGAFVYVTNIAQHKSTLRINPTWDLKVFGPHLLMNLRDDHPKMIKSIGLILAKSSTPNNVVLLDKEC